MNGLDLHRLQLGLECKAVVNTDELVRVAGDDPDDIPRVLITDLGDDVLVQLRHDLPGELKRRVRSHPPNELLHEPRCIEVALGEHAPAVLHSQRIYTIPVRHLLPSEGSVLRVHGPEHAKILRGHLDEGFFAHAEYAHPAYVVVWDSRPVSACTSSRANGESAEAWVETDPSYRRRGFAKLVVAAWARDCHSAGKVAFYSHRESNDASAGVARSLNLPQWCRQVVWE